MKSWQLVHIRGETSPFSLGEGLLGRIARLKSMMPCSNVGKIDRNVYMEVCFSQDAFGYGMVEWKNRTVKNK